MRKFFWLASLIGVFSFSGVSFATSDKDDEPTDELQMLSQASFDTSSDEDTVSDEDDASEDAGETAE